MILRLVGGIFEGKKFWTQGICFVLWALLVSCQTSLSGRLTDTQGEVVTHPDARVNVTFITSTRSAGVTEILTVNDEGRFVSNKPIEKGRYILEALVPGYRPTSMRLQLEETKDITFKLVPVPRVKRKTIGVNHGALSGRGGGNVNINPPQL